ncbi:hypothetical protein NQ314_019232, partial [Rhamnusium bicolor]
MTNRLAAIGGTAAAKLNFPADEKNDLTIESAVKDWLKQNLDCREQRNNTF